MFDGINGTLLLARRGSSSCCSDRLPQPDLLVLPALAVALAELATRGVGYRPDRDRRHRQRPIGRRSCRSSSSAPAPTTPCCSSPVTARSCASTRTSTRRWRGAAPGRAGDPRLRPDRDRGAALPAARRGRGHRRARADRRNGIAIAIDLDADPAAGDPADLRPPRVLALRPPRRGGGRGRDPRLLAPDRERSRRGPARSGSAPSRCSCSDAGVLNADTGHTQDERFRDEVDSVPGQHIIARDLPARRQRAGECDRRRCGKAAAVTAALAERDSSPTSPRRRARRRPALQVTSRGTRTRRHTTTSPRCATVEEAGGATTLVGGPTGGSTTCWSRPRATPS